MRRSEWQAPEITNSFGSSAQQKSSDPWEYVVFKLNEEATKKAAEKRSATATYVAFQNSDEPKPDAKRDGDKAAAGAPGKAGDALVANLPKLNGDDLKRVNFLQTTLTNLASVYLTPKFDAADEKLTREQRDEKFHAQILAAREQLKQERENKVFGPATQEAYRQYTGWIEKTVPKTIRELDTLKLALPAGCPLLLESDMHGRVMDPELYKALAADERLSLALNLKPGELPTAEQLDKLGGAAFWLSQSIDSMKEARTRETDARFTKLIIDHGLPQGWLKQPGDDPQTWSNSVAEMVDLSMRTKNHIEAMICLYKGSANSDFPLELPRGTKLVVEDTYGKMRTVGDNELDNEEVRSLLKRGKLKEVHLDRPLDLRQDDPANKEKIERLRDWLTRNGTRIEQAIGTIEKLKKNPDSVIMYGDQEVANGKALFNTKENPKGEFVGIVSNQAVAKPGEDIRDTNLVGYDFNVEEVNGKFKVTQTIQALKAPCYAYENIRWFGVENVGEPMKVTETTLEPEDFVPVRNGGKIEMVMAKNLKSFKEMQQAFYYGEKALTITMDAAMLISGSIECKAALHCARLAAVGAEQALKIGAKEGLWQMGKGAVKVVVAGAGIANNAGARETEVGQTINTARSIYFLTDISAGLAKSSWRLVASGKAGEGLSAAEKVHTAIYGRKAAEGVEAIEAMPWSSKIHKGTDYGFKATEFGFAPVIANDLNHQIKLVQDAGQRDPVKDATIVIGDGRGLQKSEKGSFDPANPKVLEAARQLADSYKDTLCRGRTPETAAQIKDIFDKTKTLLGPEATEQARADYRKELLAKMVLSPDQIKQLELALPDHSRKGMTLSNQDLHDLMDPDKRKNFPKPVAQLAEKFMVEEDKDVQAAARVALLYLSRDKDGKINPELAKVELEVPAYERTIIRESSGGDDPGSVRVIKVAARKSEQNASSSDVVRDLQRDLEDSNLGNRGIVTGEVLTRIGGLTHQQYGGVLQDVLKNPNSSREDKLQALSDPTGSRMAVIIDGVRHQEAAQNSNNEIDKVTQDRKSGQSHGLTSNALLTQLEKTATTDRDPDVRAMSAALLYGLRETESARRAELLKGFNTMLEQNRLIPGEYAKKTQEFLKNELKVEIPLENAENSENSSKHSSKHSKENSKEQEALADLIRDSRLNAALSLAALTSKDDTVTQSEITKTIAMSFSPTNIELSTRVLDALIPDRLQQLQKDAPAMANDLRRNAVALIKLPKSEPQETQLVAFAARMEPLMKQDAGVQKEQLRAKFHELLLNNPSNSGYAQYYPRLRVATIESLSAFGSGESLDIIRSHATASNSIKVGDKSIEAAEGDARVRRAAVLALKNMHDPFLRTIVNELVNTEKDPSVASELRDVNFTKERIEPNSAAWKKIYESTRKDLIGFGKNYEYLESFTQSAAEDWLKNNFDLLDNTTYRERADAAMKNSTSAFGRFFSYTSTILKTELDEYTKVNKQRTDQWDELVKMARGGDENANKAKMALGYIATQNGSILGSRSGLDAGAISGYGGHQHKIYERDWKERAARELKQLAESNCEGKDIVTRCIRNGLTGNKEQQGYVSYIFLDAWKALGKPDTHGYAIPREELAKVTAEALKFEIQRLPGGQADYYQADLIEDLQKYGHRLSLPVMQAIVDEPSHAKATVREKAQQMLDTMLHSTNVMWNETKPDTNSKPEERATRLKQALADGHNAEDTTQEIFNAYKDYKITDSKDPGLFQLQMAMGDTNERVRLAASRILINSDLPVSHPQMSKALATLATLALSGSQATYKNEALQQMQGLKIENNKPLFVVSGAKGYKFEKVADKVKVVEMPRGATK